MSRSTRFSPLMTVKKTPFPRQPIPGAVVLPLSLPEPTSQTSRPGTFSQAAQKSRVIRCHHVLWRLELARQEGPWPTLSQWSAVVQNSGSRESRFMWRYCTCIIVSLVPAHKVRYRLSFRLRSRFSRMALLSIDSQSHLLTRSERRGIYTICSWIASLSWTFPIDPAWNGSTRISGSP